MLIAPLPDCYLLKQENAELQPKQLAQTPEVSAVRQRVTQAVALVQILARQVILQQHLQALNVLPVLQLILTARAVARQLVIRGLHLVQVLAHQVLQL